MSKTKQVKLNKENRYSKRKKSIFLVLTILVFLVIAWLVSTYQLFSEFNTRLILAEEKLKEEFSETCEKTEVIKLVRQSVVRVVGGEAEGSGFMVDINNESSIITNFHVIEFEPSPKIIFSDNTFETGEIVMADKDSDLALIKVKKQLPALKLGNAKALNPGDELIAIGFALGGTLSGEASVSIGSLAGRRRFEAEDIDYLQMDSGLIRGVSGGPMVTTCGDVVGINTSSLTGMGFAILSHSIKEKWLKMEYSSDSLKDVKKITFEPNRSPLDAVSSFYNYLKVRKLEKAFELLSDNFNKGYSFDNWKIGYESLLDTTVIKIEADEKNDKIIYVWLTTKDLVGDQIVYRYFKGQWEVREVDDKWLLWNPNIKEVENFWELIFEE